MEQITRALLAAMGEVDYVAKRGEVKGGNVRYRFAGEADFLRVVRPAMLKHGLAMVPIATVLHEHDERVQKAGRDGGSSYEQITRTVRVVVTYRLLHSSGEHLDIEVAGEGQDAGDKATPKAMTIALKYALRQALLIETGDDPDRERSEEPEPEPEPERESKAERLFREQGEAARQILRDLGARTQADAHRLIQEATEGALGLGDLDEQPARVLAVMREYRDLQRHKDTLDAHDPLGQDVGHDYPREDSR